MNQASPISHPQLAVYRLQVSLYRVNADMERVRYFLVGKTFTKCKDNIHFSRRKPGLPNPLGNE